MPPKKSKSAKNQERINTGLNMSQKYIEKTTKMGKLDSLLLFSSSSLSLIFIIVNSLLGIERVICFSPMLIVGLAMPIYIGYIRGALLAESFRERMRGWVYFDVGLPIYFVTFVGLYLAKSDLPPLESAMIALSFISVTIIIILIVFYIFVKEWLVKLAKKFDVRGSTGTADAFAKSISCTVFAALMLAHFCSVTSVLLISDRPYVNRIVVFVCLAIPLLLISAYLENKSKKLVSSFKEY